MSNIDIDVDVQKILYRSICTTLNLIMISRWSKRELSLNNFKFSLLVSSILHITTIISLNSFVHFNMYKNSHTFHCTNNHDFITRKKKTFCMTLTMLCMVWILPIVQPQESHTM